MIDAHQHFWQLARGDYTWLTPDLKPLYRDYEPGHLVQVQQPHGVTHTVVVQAAPTLAETHFLLALADEHDFIAGVVGWIDFEASDAIHQLSAFCKHPSFVGVRPMIQDIEDPNWMLTENFTPVIEALVSNQIRFDALIYPIHITPLIKFCKKHPNLKVVVDHAAKPNIAKRQFQPWAQHMTQLATQTKVSCKLSGLVTEAESQWTLESLRPYVDHLLNCFGPARLLWGSDWPVVALAGGYHAWREVTLQLLASLNQVQRQAILGGNAETFYGLNIGRD